MKKRLFSLFLALFLLLALTPPALAVSQVEGPDTAAIARAIAEGARQFEDIQELPGPFVRTAEELAEFAQAQVDARNEEFFFYITAPELLSRSQDELSCDLSFVLFNYASGYDYREERLSDQLVRVEVQQELRPGLRMLDAWRAGDWSTLSQREQEALAVAQAEVERILAEYTDPLEIERAIHDYVCLHLTYTTDDYRPPSTYFDTGYSVSVHHPDGEYCYNTATQALLAGEANCQGFTDVFYLMASMAGFQVQNFSSWALGGKASHIVNLIELDGGWYIVDCTNDDRDDEHGLNFYFGFNAGQDLYSNLMEWEPYYTLVPIQETDEHFFFNSDSFVSCTSSSVEELAAFALGQLYEQGQEKCQMRFEGWKAEAEESDFSTTFNAAMKRQSGPNTGWSYRCMSVGDDVFVTMYIHYN